MELLILFHHMLRSVQIWALLFDDLAFCRHISQLLRFCRNRSIAEIGGLDVSHTL